MHPYIAIAILCLFPYTAIANDVSGTYTHLKPNYIYLGLPAQNGSCTGGTLLLEDQQTFCGEQLEAADNLTLSLNSDNQLNFEVNLTFPNNETCDLTGSAAPIAENQWQFIKKIDDDQSICTLDIMAEATQITLNEKISPVAADAGMGCRHYCSAHGDFTNVTFPIDAQPAPINAPEDIITQ